MGWDMVIFDLDGTLLDTIGDLGAAVDHVMAVRGLPTHTTEEYKTMVGHGVKNLVRLALPENCRDEETVNSALNDFRKWYETHIDLLTKPFPGIHELLRDLSSRGVRLAVASNKFQEGAEALIKEYFPDIRFDAVLGDRPGHPLKPDAEVVRSILRVSGLEAGTAGPAAETTAGQATGTAAGLAMGTAAETTAGQATGTAAGTSARTDTGTAAEPTAGPTAGPDAGKAAVTTMGPGTGTVAGTDAGTSKAAEGAGQLGLGGREARVVLVGDSGTDIRTARAAGVAAIAVAWGYRPATALAEALSEAFGAPAPIAYDVPALRKLLID